MENLENAVRQKEGNKNQVIPCLIALGSIKPRAHECFNFNFS